MLCAILKCVDLILYILYSNMTLSFSVKSVGCLTKLCLNWKILNNSKCDLMLKVNPSFSRTCVWGAYISNKI